MRRRIGAITAAASLATIFVQAGPSAFADEVSGPAATETYEAAAGGVEAIERLGANLPAVAAEVGMTATELRAELLSDPDLQLDRNDDLLYVDRELADFPQPEPGAEPIGEQAPPFDLADTFELHSKPGANRVIFLDFDGHEISGTSWNSGSYSSAFTAGPFDADGTPGTFNDAEKETIQIVWQRVAEDFAPFNVDVTTEAPAESAITRTDANDLVFGTRLLVSNTDFVDTCGCGGIAYLNAFDTTSGHAALQPAFVFTRNNQTSKFIAEAASHEIGHNLGLRHDGRGKGDSSGTGNEGYYTGHGNWAPIMGVGYYHPVSQWSKGEYKGANNKQDDFVVMQENGAPLVTDDYADKPAGAAFLGATFPVEEEGIISFAKDVDYFKFNAGAGDITVTITPSPNSPNLDIAAQLLTIKNKSLAKVNVASTQVSPSVAAGMDAVLTTTATAAGTFVVKIDGAANGNGSSGYSEYGSVGSYTIEVEATAPSGLVNTPPAAKITTPLTTVGVPGPVTLTYAGSTDPDGTIASTAWVFGDGTANGTGASVDHTYTATGTYEVKMTVTDNSGATAEKTVKIKAVPAITVDTLTAGTSTISGKPYSMATVKIVDASDVAVAGAKVTVSWAGPKKATGSGVTGTDGTIVIKGPVVGPGVYTATVSKVVLKDKAFNPGLASSVSVVQSF